VEHQLIMSRFSVDEQWLIGQRLLIADQPRHCNTLQHTDEQWLIGQRLLIAYWSMRSRLSDNELSMSSRLLVDQLSII